jgi:rare lipoprotein A
MTSSSRVRNWHLEIGPRRILFDGLLLLSHASFRNVFRFLAVALIAGALGACAQSPLVTNKSALNTTSRHTSVAAFNAKRHSPFARTRHLAGTHVASTGVASFYNEGPQTASGEKFDPDKLTAAHPTLPFGTRLRVTNLVNARSVTVRINDRGPFVAGRVVDVSSSAAEQLGIIDRGVAKVKLEVVR